jgi:hypothetical protein
MKTVKSVTVDELFQVATQNQAHVIQDLLVAVDLMRRDAHKATAAEHRETTKRFVEAGKAALGIK